VNPHVIQSQEFGIRASSCRHGHHHIWSRPLSRREFGRAALGTLAVTTALSTGLWSPARALALASQSGTPIPIPGTTPALGGDFHVFGPAGIDPNDAEPSTITDFNGFIGLAYLDGQVTQSNNSTGEIRTLPFRFADMRFMKGVFKGTDGNTHQGAFALV
jgi:hypothetical protein